MRPGSGEVGIVRAVRSKMGIAIALLACAFFTFTTTSSGATAANAPLPERRWVGFYVAGAPGTIGPLLEVEQKVAVRAGVSNYFQSFEQGFSAAEAHSAISHGAMPLITLEFKQPGQPAIDLDAIASGGCDWYLRPYARAAAAFGHEVWLRPMHEMNGNWYSWGGTVGDNTPDDFIRAWRHVRDVFIQEGATNVKFVWCPNIESIPNTSANAIARYWPGDTYVDYMALDGYNFGEGDGIHWRSFESLYTPAYQTLIALSDKPMFIAETGCATNGGDKAAWIAEMFRVIPQRFGRFIGMGWFHANCDRPWRVDTSVASVQAFAAGAAGPGWLDKPASAVSISASRRTVPRRRSFVLRGGIGLGASRAPVVVEVRRPRSRRWAYSTTVRSGDTGAWRYSYKPKLKGTYYFRARYLGDFGRQPSVSRTVKVVVR